MFLTIFALLVVLSGVDCKCRQSFVTLCDTVEDFTDHPKVETLTEVIIIGSEHGRPKMTSVDLMKTLQINRYNNLLTLMIVRAVNNLDITMEFYYCSYSGNRLKTLIFYGNILKTIKPYHFPYFKLKKLSLVNNQIEAVERWAFKSHEIQILDLSNNLIRVIESGSLPLTKWNKAVILRNNAITYIEGGSFSTSLKSLNLDHNKLDLLQDEVLENLYNLKELTLSHNDFTALPKIAHLQKLVVFDMSHNDISTVEQGTFELMEDLQLVDLSNNQIKNQAILTWINTPEKQPTLTVSLALNRMSELDLDGVSLQQQTFELYGNPWDCDSWSEIKKKLEGHESDCDKILSDGTIPYCIDYATFGMYENDVDRFHETVKNQEKTGCVSSANRYQWLTPINFICRA